MLLRRSRLAGTPTEPKGTGYKAVHEVPTDHGGLAQDARTMIV